MGPTAAMAMTAIALAGGPGEVVHRGPGYVLYAQSRQRQLDYTCLTAVQPRARLRGCLPRQGRAIEAVYVDQQCGPGKSMLLGVTGAPVAQLNIALGFAPTRVHRVHLSAIPRSVDARGGAAFAIQRPLQGERRIRLTAYDGSGRQLGQRTMGPFPIAQCAPAPVR